MRTVLRLPAALLDGGQRHGVTTLLAAARPVIVRIEGRYGVGRRGHDREDQGGEKRDVRASLDYEFMSIT